MTTVSSEITNMQNQTAIQNRLNSTNAVKSTHDSNMFFAWKLQQLQNQYQTSLEQMTQMNKGLEDCMNYLSAMYNDTTMNAEITQTLSLIGKEVTLKDPDDPAGVKKITGTGSEASFEEGSGQVKVGDKYYSIANILSVRDLSLQK